MKDVTPVRCMYDCRCVLVVIPRICSVSYEPLRLGNECPASVYQTLRSWWCHCCEDSNIYWMNSHSSLMMRSHQKGKKCWLKMGLCLTLYMQGPSYLGLTRSISWLLMPWLLTSPGHQPPWYWLCGIGRFLSYLRKNFNNLRHINVAKWHKM